MKTNHIHTAVALTLALACGAAAAQSGQNFVGPAIGIGVSAQNNKTPLTSQVASLNGQTAQANDTATSLLASWGFAVSDRWVTTLGLAWDLNSTDFGKVNYTAGGTQTLTLKAKEHLSLSVAPGYKVSPGVLVYGKLAYHQIKAGYTDTATDASNVDHNGTGIGLGLAVALAPQWELRAEYESVNYNSQTVRTTSGKPEQSLLTLGLLYKF
jgi:opacity protein-like surface antigen